MNRVVESRLAEALARAMRAEADALSHRWLDRISARVAIDPNHIFPSEEIIDHVPLLLEGIADYLADPTEEISSDAPVIAKAIELGELRHSQGFGADEILKEYELLGGVLFTFLIRVVDEVEEECGRAELLACAHRLFRAIAVVQQVTTNHYLRLTEERVREREERLRGFNRTVSHQLKNRLGAVMGAAEMLGEDWIRQNPPQFERFIQIVSSNAVAMEAILKDLLALSRMDPDAMQNRNVLLPEAVAEVVRQLREPSAEAGVQIRILQDLPEVEVNAPVVELCLNNYLSNAIKYHDPEAAEPWVEIGGERCPIEDGEEIVVYVRDNGIGVPEALREQLFRRFFRAENATTEGVEGTGLGLSIVRETAESLGGRAWAEFEGDRGSVFRFSLPLRSETPTSS